MKSTKLDLILLNLSVLTFSCAQIILFALVPVLAEKLSLSYGKIIGSLALGTAIFIWGSPYWAKKSEELGRWAVLRLSTFGLGFSLLILICLIQSSEVLSAQTLFIGLIISRILYGVLSSGMIPVTQLMRLDQSTDSGALFRHSLYLNIGRTFGLFLLLIVREHFIFLLSGLVLISGLLLLVSFKVQDAVHSKATLASSNKLSRRFFFPLIISILFTTYVGILHSSLGVMLKNLFSLKGDEATVLMSKVLITGSFAIALIQVIGPKVFRHHFGLNFLSGLILLGIGAYGLANITSTIQLWVSIIIISSGIGLIQPSHVALVHRRFKDNGIGKKLGLLASGNTVGYAIGGAIASVFLESSLGTASFVVIVLLFVCASGQYIEVLNENR